jgi:hypothetical protein
MWTNLVVLVEAEPELLHGAVLADEVRQAPEGVVDGSHDVPRLVPPVSASLILTWALSAGKPGPSVWPNPTADTWGQNGLADRIVYINQPMEEENYPRDHGRTGGGRSLSPCNRLEISLSSSSQNRL